MNKKIILSVLIAFSISITLFFIFQFVFQNETYNIQKEFYSKNFNQQTKKILLIGSSHVGQINATYIEYYLSKNSQEYKVYNLADTADKPKSRLNSLNQIISIKPDIVVYGLGYRDFSENEKIIKENILPDPKSIFERIFSLELYGINTEFIENPKLSTLKILQGFFGIKTLVSDTIFEDNTPFYPYHEIKTDIIVKQAEIKENDFHEEKFIIKLPSQNTQLEALNKIISEFEKNNINTIILITPHSEFYLNSLSIENKERFDLIINELAKEHDVKILNLIDSYKNMEIWRSTNHISHNPEALIYSEDIGKMILMEIEE